MNFPCPRCGTETVSASLLTTRFDGRWGWMKCPKCGNEAEVNVEPAELDNDDQWLSEPLTDADRERLERIIRSGEFVPFEVESTHVITITKPRRTRQKRVCVKCGGKMGKGRPSSITSEVDLCRECIYQQRKKRNQTPRCESCTRHIHSDTSRVCEKCAGIPGWIGRWRRRRAKATKEGEQ